MRNNYIPITGSPLTPYEKRVLDLVAQGKTNKQISELFGKTPQAIAVAIWRIGARLDVEGDLRHAVLAEQYRQLHGPYERKVATNANPPARRNTQHEDQFDDLRYQIQKALGR